MDKINELRRQRASLIDEMDELTKVEEWEEDHREKFDGLKARADALEADIERLKVLEETRRDLNRPAPTEGLEIGDGPEDRGFDSFGECLRAVIAADTPHGNVDPRLEGMHQRAASGLGEAVPSAGGFLLEEDYVADIMRRVYDRSAIIPRCRGINISNNSNSITLKTVDETSRATGSRYGGVQAYWRDEAASVTAKKPSFGKVRLELNSLMGLCYLTDELMEDIAAVGSLIPEVFADEVQFMLEDAIINGDGAGKPLGIANSGALVTQDKVSGQTATTFVAGNVADMYGRMWARSRANAVWFINQDVEPQLWTMTLDAGTAGFPVYLPPGGYSAAPYGTLYGRPVVPIEQAQTLGTAGDVQLLDLSQYLLARKGGVKQDWSMHVRFLYAEQTFRIMLRVDGQPLWQSALTPFKGTNTQSPYIWLQTRS
jgi:HK97 family phage major capsid protein